MEAAFAIIDPPFGVPSMIKLSTLFFLSQLRTYSRDHKPPIEWERMFTRCTPNIVLTPSMIGTIDSPPP
jgi:hypothetical protein